MKTDPPLSVVAHKQVDELFDIQALLVSARDVVDVGASVGEEDGNRIRRLLRIAEERVLAVIAELTPYI